MGVHVAGTTDNDLSAFAVFSKCGEYKVCRESAMPIPVKSAAVQAEAEAVQDAGPKAQPADTKVVQARVS